MTDNLITGTLSWKNVHMAEETPLQMRTLPRPGLNKSHQRGEDLSNMCTLQTSRRPMGLDKPSREEANSKCQ